LNPFREMLNTMELYGQVKGTMGSTETGFCISGAFGQVVADNPNVVFDTKLMAAISKKHLPNSRTLIFAFNDNCETLDMDIRFFLKACAEDWDEYHEILDRNVVSVPAI
jgi:hypothetical protein